MLRPGGVVLFYRLLFREADPQDAETMQEKGAVQIKERRGLCGHISVLPQVQRKLLLGDVAVFLQLQLLQFPIKVLLDAGAAHAVRQGANQCADLRIRHGQGDFGKAAAAQTGHCRVPEIPQGRNPAAAPELCQRRRQLHRFYDLCGGDGIAVLPLKARDTAQIAAGWIGKVGFSDSLP